MARIRSPGYPSISLKEGLDIVAKLHESNRTNAVDREAAVKDIGYSGVTGQSAKMLSNLAHFDLIEKAGKGGVRVTDTAVRILHPRTPEIRKAALREAAFAPGLFAEIKEQWPDGFVSENALRSFLIRQGFAPVAVAPASRAYFDTYGLLQQEGATESHGVPAVEPQDAARETGGAGTETSRALVPASAASSIDLPPVAPTLVVKVMDGERIVFVEESGPSQYLKVVVSGDLDESLLEALEDYVSRQKKRLERTKVGGG